MFSTCMNILLACISVRLACVSVLVNCMSALSHDSINSNRYWLLVSYARFVHLYERII